MINYPPASMFVNAWLVSNCQTELRSFASQLKLWPRVHIVYVHKRDMSPALSTLFHNLCNSACFIAWCDSNFISIIISISSAAYGHLVMSLTNTLIYCCLIGYENQFLRVIYNTYNEKLCMRLMLIYNFNIQLCIQYFMFGSKNENSL